MRALLIATVAALALAPAAASATVLTFDIAGGVSNFEVVPQTYGDNVSASPDGFGHSYGVGAEGFTPNVTVSYGAAGEDPNLWTTGYGDLTNILFNDTESDTTFTTTFTAGPGYLVDLYSFDMSWFFDTSTTIQGFTVRDLGTNTVLHSQGPFTLPGGNTHLTFNFATPLTAGSLALVVDLSGLGGVSDDVGLDNIRFGQQVAGVPEPQAWALMLAGFFGAGAMLRGRRRALA